MKTKCIYLLAAFMTILVLAGSCSKKEEEHGEPKVTGVTKVTVSPSSLLLELGKNQRLSVTVSPSSATASNPVSWSSSDPSVATVSSDGTVTAVGEGKAVITAQAGSKQATCEVTVEDTSYKDKERAALIAFYKANNGDKWEEGRRNNWCSDKPLREWTGIGMTEDGKHVNHLWVDDPNLCGRIPKEIADLTELELLHLANAGDYTTTYPMPSEIGQLHKLKELYLWYYPVSGTLPSALYDLENLEVLSLSHVPLDKWSIPSDIAKLHNLRELRLFDCNLAGAIPDEVGQLTGLEDLYLPNNELSGSLPASLGHLINLKYINLGCNNLSGAIPTEVATMDNYWRLWPDIFDRNTGFTMDDLRNSKIPAPKSPKIKMLSGKEMDIDEEFGKNQYTVLFNMNPRSGDAVECLKQLVSLYNMSQGKGLGIITFLDNNSDEPAYRNSTDAVFKENLSKYGVPWDSFIRYMCDDYPEGAPFEGETGLSLFLSYSENTITVVGPEKTIVYATVLDGSRDYLNNAVAYLQEVLDTKITHYESQSYALDGQVTTLQTASVGNGIDLVVTGDAFSDRNISDGTFEKAARQAVEDLFSLEPYKSMKNRFNIYMVNAVSRNEEYFNGGSTTFGGWFGYGSAVGGEDQKVLEYARKAVKDNARMDNVAVLVIMNSVRKGGTCYMMDPKESGVYAGGASVCWVPYQDVEVVQGVSSLAGTLIHEFGGHGIGKLADEYAYRDKGAIGSESVDYIKGIQNGKNWYLNVDFTSNPANVRWARFISDNHFASENIGTYEGGFTFWRGVWRPTSQSIMNDSGNHSVFNAPSRSLIWTRIMKLSEGPSWNYDYDAFVTWDKAHPASAATKSLVEADDEAPVLAAPVHVRKTWEEVMEGR